MASKAKKLLITTETHEILIVRDNRHTPIRGYCPGCATEVEMLPLDSAVRASELNGREVIKQLAADEIHSIETTDGRLLVCRNSLNNFSRQNNRQESI